MSANRTKFDTFNNANPQVYTVLLRLAREWVDRTGRRKIAIATLYERARVWCGAAEARSGLAVRVGRLRITGP